MTQETKQVFSIRKFKTGTHSALLGKASLALAATAIVMGAVGSVSADEVTTPATQPTTEVVTSTPEATPAETPTITSDIPTSVSATTTQDQAVKAVDEAQATLKDNVATAKETGVVVKEGETQEVVINDGNAADKTSEVLTDLNEQDKKVKEATAKQADNLKAYEETTTAHKEAVTEGQANLATSTSEVDKLMEQAKKAGLLVTETTTDMTPEYVEVKDLTGDELRQAMAENLNLYKEAINAGIAIQGKSVEDLKRALALYSNNQKAYTESKTARDLAVSEGQATLQKSTAALNEQIDIAKKNDLTVNESTTNNTPAYKDTKGLTGESLKVAMAENLNLYKEAINAGIAIQGKSVEDIKRALALYANNQKAYTESKTAREEAVTEGQASLSASTADVNKLIDQAKKAGLLVTETTTDNTPAYKDVKALTGDALRQAMAENLNLYKEAINAGIAIQGKSVEDLKRALALYANNQKAYTESKTARDLAVSEGQSTLKNTLAKLDEQIAIAKKNDLAVKETTTNNTPTYKDTKGLTGEALKVAMAENIKLYNEAVKASAGFMDQSTANMKKQIDAYILALADYQKGIGTNTGLKWQNGVTLTAGVGAQKMTGAEKVVNFADGTLKSAAMYATQSNAFNQNTDANFNNIFKINGSGTIYVKNTTNGDVTLTFSEINSPYNTGTYVAIWGADNGGIAWSVFATYTGRAVGGVGEAAGSGSGVGGAILNYVYSYKVKAVTANGVSVVTFNDLDVEQSIKVSGLDGATIEKGKNISGSGNDFKGTPGEETQASAGKLDSNGVGWTFETAKKQDFTFVHSVPTKNTSIVGGIFGVASEKPKEPKKPTLEAKKATVTVPATPEVPKAPSVTAQKATVTVPATPEVPKAPSVAVQKATVTVPATPEVPKAPSVAVQKVTVAVPATPEAPKPIEVDVHYYKMTKTPAPEKPAQGASVATLPETGEADNVSTIATAFGLMTLGFVGFGLKKKKEEN